MTRSQIDSCGCREYTSSHTILWYVDVRDEVRTRPSLFQQLDASRRIAVPYCDGDSLRLVEICRPEDLSPGRFGILEPSTHLRGQESRSVEPDEIEFVVVPGVAFDSRGNRLGYGKGYYDRLLAGMPDQTVRVGLAFDCQVVSSIPTEQHDIPMDWLATQTRLLDCRQG